MDQQQLQLCVIYPFRLQIHYCFSYVELNPMRNSTTNQYIHSMNSVAILQNDLSPVHK